MRRIEIGRPDDWHLHLRDGAAMRDALGASAAVFARAMVMPNLAPPVNTVDAALAYRRRILAALPEGSPFEPLMTLYLTDRTRPQEILAACNTGVVRAAKLYPAGATTNSDSGVTRLEGILPVLEAMAEHDLPLLVHGEVTDPEVDIFDREAVFLERVLAPLIDRLPQLKIVLEHVSTREGVELVRSARAGVAATVTPHHIMLNRNDLLVGGLNPHHYCLPVLKAEPHRLAVLEAATSGDPRFFLGTDSAPHARAAKECGRGSGGCYSAPTAMSLYAEAFDAVGALDRLDAFAGVHGAAFYGLPRSTGRIALVEDETAVAPHLPFGDGVVVPLRAGGTVCFRVEAMGE